MAIKETRPYVDWETIGGFLVDAFVAYGVPREDAEICADVLMESDRRGIESHGVNRFKPIYLDRIKAGIMNPVTEYEAVRNSSHYGIAGYWTTMATKQGLIGITGTNARPSIAPTFGVENMLGTNPLTIALPTDEEFPFCIDCATSITQRGKIEYYARNDKPTPAGMVIGRDGSALTDSKQILVDLTKGEAALAPLGGIGDELAGYKGYGYATVVEILSAALQAGSYMKALTGVDENGNKRPYHLGHFFIAIDPEAFMGLDTFRKTTGDILRALRNSEKAPGEERIYTAGEKEWLVWQDRKDKGVPVNEAVQKEMIAVRDEKHLNYHFSFEK